MFPLRTEGEEGGCARARGVGVPAHRVTRSNCYHVVRLRHAVCAGAAEQRAATRCALRYGPRARFGLPPCGPTVLGAAPFRGDLAARRTIAASDLWSTSSVHVPGCGLTCQPADRRFLGPRPSGVISPRGVL